MRQQIIQGFHTGRQSDQIVKINFYRQNKICLLAAWLLCLLTACSSPAALPTPIPLVTEASRPASPAAPTTTAQAAAQPTTITTPEATSTSEPTTRATITATLTPWEDVQAEVRSLRNLLDSAADGYIGLSLALDQQESNEAWCVGLNAGLNDFNYAKDLASAARLEKLQQEQGCP